MLKMDQIKSDEINKKIGHYIQTKNNQYQQGQKRTGKELWKLARVAYKKTKKKDENIAQRILIMNRKETNSMMAKNMEE